ncbi:hypothetical protein [Streptomyces luteireticuli]|uniref:Uncharacterized protein n=1 Tax=Streptomyces luteireticuli TaxID=173858 RepID=A0ABP3I0H6_9ACTN
MLRLRIQRATWPRPALILTDTPRPDCPKCGGDGDFEEDYGDHGTGEYAGTDWNLCTCWNITRSWLLMPLPRRPRWLHRSAPVRDPWASDEPPF